MTYRVTDPDVREIIETEESLSLVPFIAVANALTNKLVTMDTESLLTDELTLEIEKWLAAHFYAHRDQLLASKSTGRASGQFQGQFGKRLDSTQYGQTALVLDVTGNLLKLSEGVKRGRVIWLGKDTDSPRPDTDTYY